MRRTHSTFVRSVMRVIPAGVALALIMAMHVVANAQTSYTWNVSGARSCGQEPAGRIASPEMALDGLVSEGATGDI